MVDGDQQTQRTARERLRLRALGVTIGAGALAVPLPLPRNEIPDTGLAPAARAASAIAGGIGHDLPDARAVYAADLAAKVDQERAANGCAALKVNLALTAAAEEHSRDMGVNGYFGHDTPAGVTPWTRMEDAGYAEPAAENIAEGYQTPQEVVTGWMNDPGHRANILDCEFKAAGIGYYNGTPANGTAADDKGPWWTEDFGYE